MAIKGLDIGIESIKYDKFSGDIVIKFTPLRIPLIDLNKLSNDIEGLIEISDQEKLEIYLNRFAAYYIKHEVHEPKAIRDRAKELGLSPKEFERRICERVNEMGNISSIDIEEEPPARVDGD